VIKFHPFCYGLFPIISDSRFAQKTKNVLIFKASCASPPDALSPGIAIARLAKRLVTFFQVPEMLNIYLQA